MNDTITIIRAPHTKDRPYFAMSRAAAQNRELSFEARGMMAYLLSKPDDWSVAVKDLQQNCGRDKARAILKELAAAGYISVEQQHDKNGKFARNVYRIHESPLTENPSTGFPLTGNPTLTDNREVQSTESIVPSDDDTQGVAKPKPKKERERNPIFDAVALGSFGLHDVNGDKTVGALVGKIVKWLKTQDDVTAERIAAFYAWYSKTTPNTSAPRDVAKFATWFAQFTQQGAKPADPYAWMFKPGDEKPDGTRWGDDAPATRKDSKETQS